MRVLLVQPLFPMTYWGFHYSLPLLKSETAHTPLGLLTVAALLPAHWELELVDLNIETLTDAMISRADALLLSGMLVQAPSMLEVLQRARRLRTRTIVGGPACTTSPELFASADHIFQGEAEGRIESVVRAVEEPGAPHVLETVPAVRPPLSKAVVPRFDLAKIGMYRSMSVQYSRGCPYSCEFCDVIELFGRVPRVKSPELVLAELEALYATGFRGSVFIVDDNFIGNKRSVKQLLPRLIAFQEERGRPFSFYTEASVNLAADAELLRMMVDASFCSVFVGIETPSVAALAGAGKKQNVGVDLRAAVETITRAGIDVMGGFIVGFDTDTVETFEAQRAFLEDLPVPVAMVGILMALPGTALWKRLTREGRLERRCNGDQFTRPNFVPTMGEVEVLRGYAALMRELYSNEGYYRRAAAMVDTLGAPRFAAKITLDELMLVARCVLHVGVLSDRRVPFLRLMVRGLRRGGAGLRAATTAAVVGEHMIRYTREHLLPRIEESLGEALRERDEARTAAGAA